MFRKLVATLIARVGRKQIYVAVPVPRVKRERTTQKMVLTSTEFSAEERALRSLESIKDERHLFAAVYGHKRCRGQKPRCKCRRGAQRVTIRRIDDPRVVAALSA